MEHPAPRPDTINALRWGADAAFALLAGMQLDVFTPYVDPARETLAMVYVYRTGVPDVAIWFDRAHRTMWGGSSNHGEDYGIAWE